MNTSRRGFLKKSAIGSAMISMGLIPSCAGGARMLDEIGLIGGVIRDEIKKDYKATLRKVADIGYTYYEFGNFLGPSLGEFKSFMKEIGLVPLAGGSSMAAMIKDDELEKMVEAALALDKKYMVCYWPWMDGGENKTLDDFKIAAERLNRLGTRCNNMGIRFAFHNHDKEFVAVEGYRWGYEVILRETDPELVTMQLDLYWILKGGGDPMVLFNEYPGRYEMFHVKDMENSEEKLYTCPGYGIIDFESIFAESRQAGVKYYIVEIDRHPEPMQCIEDSYNFLKTLRF
ncbi:MAG: sugar phosphate isomerase/epimerase [Cyclobacteriaceae bacterium]|nr:sugar phosphate isomerase/epimerase [Cyclobacteriaceae bacterium]